MKLINRNTGAELWITNCDPWKKPVLMYRKDGTSNELHHAAVFRNEFQADQFCEFLKEFINVEGT